MNPLDSISIQNVHERLRFPPTTTGKRTIRVVAPVEIATFDGFCVTQDDEGSGGGRSSGEAHDCRIAGVSQERRCFRNGHPTDFVDLFVRGKPFVCSNVADPVVHGLVCIAGDVVRGGKTGTENDAIPRLLVALSNRGARGCFPRINLALRKRPVMTVRSMDSEEATLCRLPRRIEDHYPGGTDGGFLPGSGHRRSSFSERA